jgi:hypothetical protein
MAIGQVRAPSSEISGGGSNVVGPRLPSPYSESYNLPGMATTPSSAMFAGPMEKARREIYNQTQNGGTGLDQLNTYGKYAAAGSLLDPMQNQNIWKDAYYGDPRIQQAQQGYDQSLGAFGDAAGGYSKYANNFLKNDIGALRNQAYGQGPSYAEQYGAAQRQQAQGDIAKQAAMGARGGMSAADRRAAIMQSSNVGANMAAQIAAARTQERQAAMQQYLQARQAQLQARGMGVEALGAVNNAQAGRYGMDQTGWGGFTQAGQTTTAQQGNAFWPGPK